MSRRTRPRSRTLALAPTLTLNPNNFQPSTQPSTPILNVNNPHPNPEPNQERKAPQSVRDLLTTQMVRRVSLAPAPTPILTLTLPTHHSSLSPHPSRHP